MHGLLYCTSYKFLFPFSVQFKSFDILEDQEVCLFLLRLRENYIVLYFIIFFSSHICFFSVFCDLTCKEISCKYSQSWSRLSFPFHSWLSILQVVEICTKFDVLPCDNISFALSAITNMLPRLLSSMKQDIALMN